MYKFLTLAFLLLSVLTACNDSADDDECLLRFSGVKQGAQGNDADTKFVASDENPSNPEIIDCNEYFSGSGRGALTRCDITQSAPGVITRRISDTAFALFPADRSNGETRPTLKQSIKLSGKNSCDRKPATANVGVVLGFPMALLTTPNAQGPAAGNQIAPPRRPNADALAAAAGAGPSVLPVTGGAPPDTDPGTVLVHGAREKSPLDNDDSGIL